RRPIRQSDGIFVNYHRYGPVSPPAPERHCARAIRCRNRLFAMRIAALLQPIERLHDALTNPARREWAAALMLTGYAAVWALYAAIAKSSQDINFDMGEAVAWSREIALG